jgi:phage terminase large subunit
LVLESKADMQKRGQASPDDGDALALTFAQAVAPTEVEERDEDEEIFGGYGTNGQGALTR